MVSLTHKAHDTAEECKGALASPMKQIKLVASGITRVITEASL